MFKKMCFLTALILIFLTGVTYGAVVTEVEPNNAPEKANHFTVGDAVRGQINYGDGSDYFTTVLPQSGIVTVSASGYPSDCRVQVMILGFHPKYLTTSAGSVNSDSGRPSSFSFSATGQKTGYISVSLSSTASGVCSDWCAVQCTANGPYYLTPFHDRPMKNVPSTYNGKPVLPPIQYQFSVALQALPDSYEPNHDNHPSYDFISLDQRLQKGIIKTIPIGQEITAYLFNEYPNLMRGTKGSEQSPGGENDTDIYHIYLNQPDTVKVTLKNFPQNANSRIIITARSGYDWEESPTGATYFEKKVKDPGNVFIEISKGRENRQLIYSTTPYKMLVTTGAATVVTPQPYQLPVVTQPPVITQPPVTTTVSAQPVGWNTTAVDKGGKNGQQFTYNCSPNGSPATVWGTDVYTNDSSICTSAVHSGLISFQAGGSVTIEIRQGQSSYTGSTRNGVTSKGYGSWNGSFVFVGQISQPPYQPPVTIQTTGVRELIGNGTLKNLNGWTIHEWYKPSDGKGEVTVAGDGVRFKSISGNNRIGIMQTINADVSSCSSLVLSATVKADYQTLTGTGWQGREAPVALFMSYTDINGTVHNQLSENPNDTARRMFWHGFYYADLVPPSLTVFGTKVSKSSWHTYTVDLAALNPRPKFIQFMGAEGAGWPQRDGKIGSMSLKCTGGEVSIQQPYQPPVTTQPDTVIGQPYQPAVAISAITVNQTAAHPGEKITVYFSGIQNPAQQDWISLYRTGAPNEKYGEWYYLKGQSGGTLTFTVPNEPGGYEFRMFLNWPSGGYKDVARSQVISIVPRGGELPIVPQTTEPPQYYQPPVTSEPPQQYQPPVTSQPPTGNYPQGDVFTPQGQDDFWKGNIFERK